MSRQFHYPQKPLTRTILRGIGRAAVPLLTRTTFTGLQNFPKKGPVIVVGNHTGALEVVLMTIFTPQIVEYVGSMDIPHEPFIAAFVKLYGVIPILRGQTSRASMMKALDVLKQDGYLGVFPEGGIWEPAIHDARTGVAWLSYHANAPVLPIGFASTQGALNKLIRFQRPELEMNIGTLIPPVTIPEGKPRKLHFQDAANAIMDAVYDLVPASVKDQETTVLDERFELRVRAFNTREEEISIPPNHCMPHGAFLSKFIHRPTLFNNLRDNLNLPINALQHLHEHPDNHELLHATNAILTYLKTDNPYYFTYRYGQKEGSSMQSGIQELHHLAVWANNASIRLQITPIRRFRTPDSSDEVVLDRPEEIKKW